MLFLIGLGRWGGGIQHRELTSPLPNFCLDGGILSAWTLVCLLTRMEFGECFPGTFILVSLFLGI